MRESPNFRHPVPISQAALPPHHRCEYEISYGRYRSLLRHTGTGWSFTRLTNVFADSVNVESSGAVDCLAVDTLLTVHSPPPPQFNFSLARRARGVVTIELFVY